MCMNRLKSGTLLAITLVGSESSVVDPDSLNPDPIQRFK